MSQLKQEFKKEYEEKSRIRMLETISSLREFIKDKELTTNKFQKQWFLEYLEKILKNESSMTIDKLARWLGFAIAHANFETKERFKPSEISIRKPQKDCSFINTFGHFIDKFFTTSELPSDLYDYMIVRSNKKIIKRLSKMIKEGKEFQEPFDQHYLKKLSRLLLLPKSYEVTMINHSIFVGYLQGTAILNDFTTVEDERDFSRPLYQEIYMSFGINQIKITV